MQAVEEKLSQHDVISIANMLCQIPAERHREILEEASGEPDLMGAEIEQGSLLPWYRPHPNDWKWLKGKLHGHFIGRSFRAIEDAVKRAHENVHYREFGHKNLVRNCNPENPYWFEDVQIKEIKAKLAAGEAYSAAVSNLHECNHGHSGFTGQVLRVYKSPRNDEERRRSLIFRQLHIDVIEALLSSAQPVNGLFEFMDVSVTFECLCRLGTDVPYDYADHFMSLLQSCLDLDPTVEHVRETVRLSNERFCHTPIVLN